MNALAIIPARGGSKRIPRKNIKLFHGKPIIQYAIEAALKSGVFSEVMVSTDDEEIAKIATQAGAKIPFMRSNANSDDFATMGDAVIEVLQTYKSRGQNFSYFGCVYPTAALVTAKSLRDADALMNKPGVRSVIAVTQFGFPIQRALKVENGMLAAFEPKYHAVRSQDLAPAYHDSGQFFFCQTEDFLTEKKAMTANTQPLFIPDSQTQDIDNEEDWILAELKFELMKRNGA